MRKRTREIFLIILLSPLFFVLFYSPFVKPASAASLSALPFADDFTSGASGWNIAVKKQDSGGNWTVDITSSYLNKITPYFDSSDPEYQHSLRINYTGQNEWVTIKKSLDSAVSNQSNLVYEIVFWDGPTGNFRNYGAGFYVSDANGRYLEFIVDGSKTNYRFRNGAANFDTGIPRSEGWHKIQIFVTDVGSYLALDGQSLVYLRGQIPASGPAPDGSSFPINNLLKHAVEVGIEYPGWNKPASLSYWTAFRVYQFRPQAKTTPQKEEDLLKEFANKYDSNYSYLINPPANLKAIQNFQLARLGLAAAYGVRGNTGDLEKMKVIMSKTADDFPLWDGAAPSEAPISGQALATLLSWKYNVIDSTLKNKITAILPTIANQIVTNMNSGWANPMTTLDPDGSGTRAEEHAWMASYLGFAADILPRESQSGVWADKAKILACNSTSSRTTKSQYSCEVSEVLTPNSLRTSPPNFLLFNHWVINPDYALTLPWGMEQATLYKLNKGKALPVEYTKNITSLYDNAILPQVRLENYTYEARSDDTTQQAKLIRYTGREDWGHDATMQDNSWAFIDKLRGSNLLSSVVNYAWLTRAGGTVYPVSISGLDQWINTTNVNCGDGTYCHQAIYNSGLSFFINGMDAVDRFMALFLIAPNLYSLQVACTPTTCAIQGKNCGTIPDGCGGTLNCGTCTPPETCGFTKANLCSSQPGDLNGDGQVNITDLQALLANFSNIFNYNLVVANYGKTP